MEVDGPAQHQDLNPEVLLCEAVHHQLRTDTDRHNQGHSLEVLRLAEVVTVLTDQASNLGMDPLVAMGYPDSIIHLCPRMVTMEDRCRSSFRAIR